MAASRLTAEMYILAYGLVIHRKFTMDIFQLMSFSYCMNLLVFQFQ